MNLFSGNIAIYCLAGSWYTRSALSFIIPWQCEKNKTFQECWPNSSSLQVFPFYVTYIYYWYAFWMTIKTHVNKIFYIYYSVSFCPLLEIKVNFINTISMFGIFRSHLDTPIMSSFSLLILMTVLIINEQVTNGK